MKTGITINGKPVEVPSSFDELTFGQFLRLKESETDAETMCVLTSIELEVCKNIAPELMNVILAPASDLGEVVYLDKPTVLGKPVPDNLGKMEYARKVNCDNLSRNYKDEEMVGRMVAIYMAEGIEDEDIEATYNLILNESFTNVVSAGKMISEQLVKMSESEAKIPSPQYESAELQAGIKNFSKYGVWGVVRGIALRHGCKMEDVYSWSYNTVLLELKYSAEENSFQRRLNRIMNKPK